MRSGGRTFALLPALLLLVLLAPAREAPGYNFGSTVQPLGPEETVFDWTTQRCDDNFSADVPARAWRDASNQVHLVLGSNASYSMVGPSLSSVTVNCGVLLPSHFNGDPSKYDDQEWVASSYTPDGTKVYSLVHEEFHGWEHPGYCSSQGHPDKPKVGTVPAEGYNPGCWYNAITFASSSNGGYSFTQATPPAHLVASSSYKYVQSPGAYGYFNPSNIIRRSDNYYYALLHAEAHGAQQVGVCVIRSKNPTNPTSWRAWDGTGYNVSFINPYVSPDPPENHVCAPVAFAQIEKMSDSVTYNTYFGKYLLTGVTQVYDPIRGETVYGVYYSTSTDLVNWSQATLLMEAELPWSWQCGDDNPILYPALLNPSSTARNFDTTGQKVYLYFTRFNFVDCVGNNDRDMLRIPIKFIGTPTVTG